MAKAKYDAITLSTAWAGTLEVLNQGPSQFLAGPLTDQVRVDTLSAYAEIKENGVWVGPPIAHGAGDDPPNEWVANYFRYVLTVETPPAISPATDTVEIFLWNGDLLVVPPTGALPLPAGAVVVQGSGFSADFVVSAPEIFLKGQTEDATPASREFMWFGDRDFDETWFVVAGSDLTVSMSGAWGSISATGTLGLPGGDLELGTDVAVTTTLAADAFDTAGATIARISDLEFHSVDTSLDNLDLYNPGDAGAIIDPVNAPGWSREESAADRARVGDDGGIAMWAEGTYVAAASWVGVIKAPHHVVLFPRDGKFGDY